MRRYRDHRPADICFARGTFNSHPYVMATMNEFLRRLDQPERRAALTEAEACWNARAAALNARLSSEELPVRVANLSSIWTILYTRPSRYSWMFQFYLHAEGVLLGWTGTGRLIFSHNYTEADFQAVASRFVSAAQKMKEDGWWWHASSLTRPAITRMMLREIIAAVLTGRRAQAT